MKKKANLDQLEVKSLVVKGKNKLKGEQTEIKTDKGEHLVSLGGGPLCSEGGTPCFDKM